MTNIHLLRHCSLFPGGSNEMAADIASLAPGLDVHALNLGIGPKGLRKKLGTIACFFLGALTLPLSILWPPPFDRTLFLSYIFLDTATGHFDAADQLPHSSFHSSY
jgi:hypothetical protein